MGGGGGSDVWEKFSNNIVFFFESVPYLFNTLVTGIGRGTGVVTCILPAETFSVGQVHKTHHLLASYIQNTAKGTTDLSVENLI